jgi:hypothetical protein
MVSPAREGAGEKDLKRKRREKDYSAERTTRRSSLQLRFRRGRAPERKIKRKRKEKD